MSKSYIAILDDTHSHTYKTVILYHTPEGTFTGRELHCITCGQIRYEGVATPSDEGKIASDIAAYMKGKAE